MLSSHFLRVVWRFLKPEIEEVIVYVISIIGFAGIAFYQAINRGYIGQSQTISDSLAIIHDNFTFITSGGDGAAKLFTFGTWFIIGTVVYMIAWFFISFASGAFKDIEVSNTYVHPRSFNKSNFWGAIMARIALQGAAAISFIIYASIWLTIFAPAWLANYKDLFLNGINSDTLIGLLVSIVGIAVTLHVGEIILRVMLLRSKYFYER